MLRDGIIPAFVHGIIEYVAGVLLIIAPFVLAYDSGAATAVSIVLGVFVIALAASTEGSTSMMNGVPVSVHLVLDLAFAALLIASPFIFSFSGESAPTVVFIALGIAHLLISLGTRFREPAGAR